MMFSVILVTIMALGVSGQSSTDIFFTILGTLNPYNAPTYISGASTTPSNSVQPSQKDMEYYSLHALSSYCTGQLHNLSCTNCQKFKNEINSNNGVIVLQNNTYNTLAYITVSDKHNEIVVTCRGTMPDLKNYLLDLTLFNTGTGDIKFHQGFYTATMSLFNNVTDALRNQLQLYPTYDVVFVGHSLGGAMARLTLYFVISLSLFPGKNFKLITFGEPRVGNKGFADFFNRMNFTTARCVNNADVVSHVPPTSVKGTEIPYDYYIHPQPEVWILNITIQICNRRYYEDPNCSNRVDPSYNIGDHSKYFNLDGDCGEIVTPASQTGNPPSLPTNIFSFLLGLIG